MSNLNIIDIRSQDGNIVKFEVHNTLPSTVSLAREYAKQGYPDRYVVFSERIEKSKFTGHKYSSNQRENGVFMSIILRPSLFPSQASMLGPMSAAALISGLREHTDSHLGLGWVSDLYCKGVKIGSTAIEGRLDNFTTYEYIIISFYARIDNKSFPPKLNDMIQKVFDTENSSISMIIAKSILNKFFGYYSAMKTSNKYVDECEGSFILKDKRIKYIDNDKKSTAKIKSTANQFTTLILEPKKGQTIELTSQNSLIMPRKVNIKR